MKTLRNHLLDVHERSHRSLAALIEHAAEFSVEEADREHEGFGYPSLRLQIHHVLGAERYWLSVIEGQIEADDDSGDYPTIASLEALRAGVAERARTLVLMIQTEDLQIPRPLRDWRGNEVFYTPARVFMRTQMHLFHHLGQMTAMCRLLGRPLNGIDFDLN